jgi:8-oxo-dGTP pyrophosphatase MutT (NUDIX family)
VTVAAVVERDGRFLLVEEMTAAGLRINQPAGHLEPGESLQEATARETLEETACRFEATALLGTYLGRGADGVTYLRFAFVGAASEPVPGRALDREIIRALWLTRAQLQRRQSEHRSALVMQCVDDYLAGRRYPLESIFTHANIFTATGAAAPRETE